MNDHELGWSGRVMQVLRIVTNLVLINLLVLAGMLAGLVVLGAFPAALAAARLYNEQRAGEPAEHTVRAFVAAYRRDFRRGALLGAPFMAAAALIALNVWLATNGLLGAATGAVLTAMTFAAVGVVLAGLCTVAIAARYHDGPLATWRYAFVLPLVSPVMSLGVLVTLAGCAVASAAWAPIALLFGASAPLFAATWLVDHRLARLDPTHPMAEVARADPVAGPPTFRTP